MWKKFLDVARDCFSESVFDTWIKPMTLDNVDGDTFVISVPNDFFRDWILENYHEQIRNILSGLAEKEAVVKIAVSHKEARKEERQKKLHPDLIQRYSFDNFISGPSNEFAYAAARAVADSLGTQYNPLLIYSNVGLGKTHLMTAIGHEVFRRSPSKKILYYPSVKFVSEFISSVRFKKIHEFQDKFRSVDLLLVDDIQFFSGKDMSQDEFFNTFNALYESKKQIVITSDKMPKQLQNIEDRLKNRFEWGLIVDIQPPEYETRVAILKSKASFHNIYLPDDIAAFIATNFCNNVREMEGALIKILAYSSLTKKPLSLGLSKQLLEDFVPKTNGVVSIETIQKAVSDYFQIKISDLKSQKKMKNIAQPRQIAIYLCRKLTSLSLNDIGSKFGGKDHSTVIHSINKITKLIEQDETMKKHVNSINSMLIKY